MQIQGEVFWLWQAVEEDGNVLDILMPRRSNQAAAKKLMRKPLNQQGFAPGIIVTDKLKSYAAAKAVFGCFGTHLSAYSTAETPFICFHD